MTPPRQAKLRGILAERGISQKAVAKAIGMNENYFSDRMTGDVDFRWSEVLPSELRYWEENRGRAPQEVPR